MTKLTLKKAYRIIFDILSSDTNIDSAYETKLLLAFFTNYSMITILTHPEKEIDETLFIKIKESAKNRIQNKPLSFILGYKDFYKHRFLVSPQTLIPRDDSEVLLEEIEKNLNLSPQNILDIGTGTGCLAISLGFLFPKSQVDALDIFIDPILQNIKYHHVSNVHAFNLDFLKLKETDLNQKYDLIISNPPYLNEKDMENLDSSVKDYEPRSALFAPEDGMLFYKAISEKAPFLLKKNGILVLEIDYKVDKILTYFTKFEHHKTIYDYNHLERGVVLSLK